MTQCVDRLGRTAQLGVADGAVDDLVIAACLRAGRRDLVLTNRRCLGVTRGRNDLLRDLIVATRAMAALGQAGLRAGGRNGRVGHKVMTQRRDHRAGLEQHAASLAVGIAGVAVVGAGRRLDVAQLGLGMLAERTRILQRDVVDRGLIALGVSGTRIAEGETHALLAIEHGDRDLGRAGLIEHAVDRQLGGIPDRRPRLAVVGGGDDGQVDLAGLERVASQRIVKGQHSRLAAQVDRR